MARLQSALLHRSTEDAGISGTHQKSDPQASMQEMNEFSIASYFSFLRRRSSPSSRFYCANRLWKQLPGGEIASFNDYPWQEDDEIFFDGPCPYYTHFFARYTLANGPRVLGRVPFINYCDGIHMHRLVRLVALPLRS